MATEAHRGSAFAEQQQEIYKIHLLMNNSAIKHLFPLLPCRKAFGGCVRVCLCVHSCMQPTSIFFFLSTFTLCAHDKKKIAEPSWGGKKVSLLGGFLSIKLF